MRVYFANKTSQEVEFDPGWIAGKFVDAMCAASYRVVTQGITASEEDENWVAKLAAWPLERTLRNWLTSPHGLHVSWLPEDEDEFGQIRANAQQMLVEAKLWP